MSLRAATSRVKSPFEQLLSLALTACFIFSLCVTSASFRPDHAAKSIHMRPFPSLSKWHRKCCASPIRHRRLEFQLQLQNMVRVPTHVFLYHHNRELSLRFNQFRGDFLISLSPMSNLPLRPPGRVSAKFALKHRPGASSAVLPPPLDFSRPPPSGSDLVFAISVQQPQQ